MEHATNDGRERLLDPVDRISEILFGLIMAVTIVGSLSIATAGQNEVRTVLIAALGCNFAWGLVDAVMYLVRTMTERTRYVVLGKRVMGADAATAQRMITSTLPEHLAQITGAILDGPLALDNAINLESVAIKKIDSPVAGRANVLVVPDLEAGNMLAKSLTFLAGADAAGIVLGARVPIILTSRADSVTTRLASCAIAALVAKSRRDRAGKTLA